MTSTRCGPQRGMVDHVQMVSVQRSRLEVSRVRSLSSGRRQATCPLHASTPQQHKTPTQDQRQTRVVAKPPQPTQEPLQPRPDHQVSTTSKRTTSSVFRNHSTCAGKRRHGKKIFETASHTSSQSRSPDNVKDTCNCNTVRTGWGHQKEENQTNRMTYPTGPSYQLKCRMYCVKCAQCGCSCVCASGVAPPQAEDASTRARVRTDSTAASVPR